MEPAQIKVPYDNRRCMSRSSISSRQPGVPTLPVPKVSTSSDTGIRQTYGVSKLSFAFFGKPGCHDVFGDEGAMYAGVHGWDQRPPESAAAVTGRTAVGIGDDLFLSVSPVSPAGPPMTKRPVG